MHPLLIQVVQLLDRANREAVNPSPEVLDAFAAACRHSLERQFSGPQKNAWTLRMSNAAKPLCQLQRERDGDPAEPPPYNHKIKMLLGDLVEAVTIAVLDMAGVEVSETQGKVSLEIGGTKLDGTFDMLEPAGLWDIKSASSYAFKNKFSKGGKAVLADDPFGYGGQGFGYAEAKGVRFQGWIAVNKETGEFAVADLPKGEEYEELKATALNTLDSQIRKINDDVPFARCFEDVPEVYFKKETGNRVLGMQCSFCAFKHSCWPGVDYRPQIVSKGQSPQWKYYTHIADEWKNDPV
jgi:hypothetical protein